MLSRRRRSALALVRAMAQRERERWRLEGGPRTPDPEDVFTEIEARARAMSPRSRWERSAWSYRFGGRVVHDETRP